MKGLIPKRTTPEDFQKVSQLVINFISTKQGPVDLSEIEQYFISDDLPIPAGRVILNLIADQVLYFTEDRKIMKSGALL